MLESLVLNLKRKPPLMLILVTTLVALLALLATLQYRWLGQVSQGERERMQASLRAGATRFGQDFNREITRAFLNFQLEASSLDDKAGPAYGERYDNWMTTAPYPKLVDGLFLVAAGNKQNGPRLSRFNREATRFEPSEWPAGLARLRQRLEQEYQNNSMRPEPGIEFSIAPIAEEVPALVIPVIPVPPFPRQGKDRVFEEGVRPLIPGYTIVTLNLEYMRQEFIPMLAGRYFSGGGGLDYNLAVVSRSDPGNIIYSSGPTRSGAPPFSGDATANIFDLRLDQFDVLVLEKNHREGEDEPGRRPFFAGVRVARIQAPPFLLPPPAEGVDKSRRSRSLTFRYHNSIKDDQSGAALVNDADGRWQLLIQHRAGSLEAAVNNARRRNLAVSFGILLLLAVSVAVIIISTQRAQRLARQQIEFVAGVSHELRTPLAVICSAGENLADGVIETPKQVARYGALIRSEGRRLAKMVEQVLEFAGAQAARKTYEMRPARIDDLIESALAAVEPLIEEGGFEVSTEIQPNLPQVMVDSEACERALQNLLSNAIKYAGASRWIGVRAKIAEGESRAQRVLITVEDRGPGIHPDDLPHIFEPFYRGQEATAAQIHGSGLGLSLVKRIIEAHQGKVSVESTPGRGASFTLRLPAVAPAVVVVARDNSTEGNHTALSREPSAITRPGKLTAD